MNWQQQYELAKQFLRGCKDKSVIIFHDSDADGIGAGFQLYHALVELGAKPQTHTHVDREEILSQEAYLKYADADRIIICDVNPKSAQTHDAFKEVFGNKPTLIIDHHHVEQYSDEIFVHAGELNSVEGSDYCTAKQVYDLTTDVLGHTKYAWLAAIGIIGDFNQEFFMDTIEIALSQEGFDSSQDIRTSELYAVNVSIHCCQAIDDTSLQAYLVELRACTTLKQAYDLGNPHPEVLDTFNEIVEYADSQVGAQDVIWIYLDTEFGIVGWVSNTLTTKHPNETIIVYRDKAEFYTMSLRNQSRKVHLGQIAHKCANTVGGSGGGHLPAAGAQVPKEQFKRYQQLVEQEVRNHL